MAAVRTKQTFIGTAQMSPSSMLAALAKSRPCSSYPRSPKTEKANLDGFYAAHVDLASRGVYRKFDRAPDEFDLPVTYRSKSARRFFIAEVHWILYVCLTEF